MTPSRARIALSLTLVASCSACDVVELEDKPHSHDVVGGGELGAELPRIASNPLAYYKHSEVTLNRPRVLALAGARHIQQTVLLLAATGEEPSFAAARDALERIGIPHQALIAAHEEVTTALLGGGVSTCNFNSIVFATSGLGYYNSSAGEFASALSPEEWTRISDFELACSAREAIWYAWPSSDLGLTFVSAFGSADRVDGAVADPTFFKRVRSTAAIPYRNAAGYRASIIDSLATRALVQDASGGVLLALHTRTDGREVLVSTVDSNPYLTHALTLEYDMLRWLTRGLFVGQKRAYSAPQIDDIFVDNHMWIAGIGNHGAREFRITGADLSTFVTWQTIFKQRLPAGSTFMTRMAFNGVGTTSAGGYADPTLLTAARNAGTKLLWLNHTWDHENMDLMTRSDAKAEVAMNCRRARDLKLAGFACTELVTPDMSGLTNSNAVLGMIDGGIRYVVSDTSITEQLRPENPGTNPSFNVGRYSSLDARLYQVPRHPTSVFYDVETPEVQTDEYNHMYRSYYGRDLSYEEVTDKSSAFGLFYLLQGDIDPLMFHQANLADYGGGRSLYGDWMDVVANKFLALSNAPILTLSQAAIGEAMKARGKLDGCSPSATVVESTTGRKLEVSSSSACTVPVTGLSASSHGKVVSYAGESTTSIAMPAGGGTVTVTLP